uniref:Uncharacterized protein n=1 Tax=Rhizophora mucronata TaxID=61149 RepID=A0A2P2PYQ5_RHIMU
MPKLFPWLEFKLRAPIEARFLLCILAQSLCVRDFVISHLLVLL